MAKPFRPAPILLFLRRSFFARALTRTNEVERFEYSGSWLRLSPAFTGRRGDRLAHGKLYPVTAAQLLRFRTGFLAPIH